MLNWKVDILAGDVVIFASALGLVIGLFVTQWDQPSAGKVLVRSGDKIFATLSLNQKRTLEVPGPLGISRIVIDGNRVRVASDPGVHQYCVKQGWLSHAGQIAMCLPNRVSVELLGEKHYDSLNY